MHSRGCQHLAYTHWDSGDYDKTWFELMNSDVLCFIRPLSLEGLVRDQDFLSQFSEYFPLGADLQRPQLNLEYICPAPKESDS